jgi:hypothetical protein
LKHKSVCAIQCYCVDTGGKRADSPKYDNDVTGHVHAVNARRWRADCNVIHTIPIPIAQRGNRRAQFT